jgi:hypothetical protein
MGSISGKIPEENLLTYNAGERGDAPGFSAVLNCKGLAQQGKPDQSLVTDRRSF